MTGHRRPPHRGWDSLIKRDVGHPTYNRALPTVYCTVFATATVFLAACALVLARGRDSEESTFRSGS